MLDHTDFHCSNYNVTRCPQTCYRAQLTEELLSFSKFSGRALWKHYGSTKECPLRERPQKRTKTTVARAYYQRNKEALKAYARTYYAENKDTLRKIRKVKNEHHA